MKSAGVAPACCMCSAAPTRRLLRAPWGVRPFGDAVQEPRVVGRDRSAGASFAERVRCTLRRSVTLNARGPQEQAGAAQRASRAGSDDAPAGASSRAYSARTLACACALLNRELMVGNGREVGSRPCDGAINAPALVRAQPGGRVGAGRRRREGRGPTSSTVQAT